jgi:hypothetical protein
MVSFTSSILGREINNIKPPASIQLQAKNLISQSHIYFVACVCRVTSMQIAYKGASVKYKFATLHSKQKGITKGVCWDCSHHCSDTIRRVYTPRLEAYN